MQGCDGRPSQVARVSAEEPLWVSFSFAVPILNKPRCLSSTNLDGLRVNQELQVVYTAPRLAASSDQT